MKKKYESPKIIFESFKLSSSIAAGCEFIQVNPHAAYECAVRVPDLEFSIFVEGSCDYSSPGAYDQICYDVPLENYNVFSS